MRRLTQPSKLCLTTVLLLLSTPLFAAWTLNMPKGVTPISHDIYDLHMTILWICVVIGILVFGVMIYSLIMHRKSRGHKAHDLHEHRCLEILWTVVPAVILIIMAIPATIVLISMYDSSEPDITIKVTGYQWRWHYDYLDQDIGFFSSLSTPAAQLQNKAKKGKWYLREVDKPLVVPIHKKIRFLVTSNDVIHSWWVPALGIKRDAIPGFIYEAWARIKTPGTYRGQCAELCGMLHAFMPIVVKAVPQKEFEQWVKSQTTHADKTKATAKDQKKIWTKKALMVAGKKEFDTTCAPCHKATGLGLPPVFPALKGNHVTTGKSISRNISVVLYGVTGTAMQAFGKELSDVELAAIITYVRNAWGNNTGDVVQPKDIAEVRKQSKRYSKEELLHK